jgi:hypothetical protein
MSINRCIKKAMSIDSGYGSCNGVADFIVANQIKINQRERELAEINRRKIKKIAGEFYEEYFEKMIALYENKEKNMDAAIKVGTILIPNETEIKFVVSDIVVYDDGTVMLYDSERKKSITPEMALKNYHVRNSDEQPKRRLEDYGITLEGTLTAYQILNSGNAGFSCHKMWDAINHEMYLRTCDK